MRRFMFANSILWATAILVAAILRAPTSLTVIFLPMLATTSLVMVPMTWRRRDCEV